MQEKDDGESLSNKESWNCLQKLNGGEVTKAAKADVAAKQERGRTKEGALVERVRR